MLVHLTLAHWLTLHGLITAVAVLVYVLSAHVRQQRRPPTAAIAWMLFIILVPYLGLPALILFGSRKLRRPHGGPPPSPPRGEAASDAWAVECIVAVGQPTPAAYRALQLHVDGVAARDALLEVIAGARVTLDLCTFILAPDEMGDSVLELLARKARSGVRVRLLLDGLGRLMAPRASLGALRAAGGEVALFAPPLLAPWRGGANLRNHRKLVVADATTDRERLWCGGRNIAVEYFVGRPDVPPWRDLSFDVQGPLVSQGAALFERDWAFARRRSPSPLPRIEREIPTLRREGAQLIASGPDQGDDTIYAVLVAAAFHARRRIAVATPYFVPDSALLLALCLAARRGVSVELLLPASSNHQLSDLVRGRALRALADAGGTIWMTPGMMHAKLVVVDDAVALGGSANVDSRSLFINYELMMAFHDTADVRRFAAWFDDARSTASRHMPVRPGLVRDIFDGLLLWVGFQL